LASAWTAREGRLLEWTIFDNGRPEGKDVKPLITLYYITKVSALLLM